MSSRLRQRQRFTDPGLARLAELVRAVQPLAPSTAQKRRVQAALEAVPRRRRPTTVSRVAVLLLCSGGLAFAGALATRRVLERRQPVVTQLPSLQAAPRPGATRMVATQPPATQPVVTQLPATPPVVTQLPVVTPQGPAGSMMPSGSAVARPAQVERARRPVTSPRQLSDGPRELAAALAALRRDHDPARAGSLAAHYVAVHPNGALVEEALILAFEAARAVDSDGAAEATRYLARFPDGRFAAQARAALP